MGCRAANLQQLMLSEGLPRHTPETGASLQERREEEEDSSGNTPGGGEGEGLGLRFAFWALPQGRLCHWKGFKILTVRSGPRKIFGIRNR